MQNALGQKDARLTVLKISRQHVWIADLPLKMDCVYVV